MEQREVWQAQQPTLDYRRLYFLDETNANTTMTRLYGRALIGERVTYAVPYRHWESTTLLSVLNYQGAVANVVYKGGTDIAVFEAFVACQLSKVLKPGDILVMDNLATHKSPSVLGLFEKMNVRVALLPPYSPDFNPIENMFSKVKAYLKKVMQGSTKPLWKLIGEALNQITPKDARNFFTHCGYNVLSTPKR